MTEDSSRPECIACGDSFPDEYGKYDPLAPVYADDFAYHLGCEDEVFDEVCQEVDTGDDDGDD